MLQCLRSADVSALQAANTKLNLAGFFGTFTFVPVVDGEFIVERPTLTLERGKVNGVSQSNDRLRCALANDTVGGASSRHEQLRRLQLRQFSHTADEHHDIRY